MVIENSIKPYSVANHTGSAYTWRVDGGSIASGSNSNSITVQWGSGASGLLRLVELDSSGCLSDTSTKSILIQPNGIDEVYFNNLLKIYPNPTNDVLYIAGQKTNSRIDVVMYDIMGQRVWEGVVGQETNNGRLQIDMSKLSAGPYLLKLNDGEREGVIRIIRN